MAARSPRAPRIHRLPQRLDYALIPAPLDLTLPVASEKSPLPAIIVTPSSPSSTHDFSIAFLAPPRKPSIRERISEYLSQSHKQHLQCKARWTVILTVLLFIMACHVLAHRLAIVRPHLQFDAAVHEGVELDATAAAKSQPLSGWLDLQWLLAASPAESDEKREFIVREFTQRNY
ncbi:hypothetical protein OE88DRAFT_725882 [Heliocybe sulcata]|uniref:Uncharacterized protein n=1 Tax=Heliocybe sulcata TaxID=5364 RepID=A0A5C3NJG2_9AGAM|nr:hypothetical protein OE88DRAFT_725882 [Heliocybe sulcata]